MLEPESRSVPALQWELVLRLARLWRLVAQLQLARAEWLGLGERWLWLAQRMKMGWLWARVRRPWSQ